MHDSGAHIRDDIAEYDEKKEVNTAYLAAV